MSKTQIALIFALALMENRISQSYMNNKLSYEEFCEKYLYEPEFDDDMISAYLADGIDIVAIYEKARRAEYQDYLDGKHTNE